MKEKPKGSMSRRDFLTFAGMATCMAAAGVVMLSREKSDHELSFEELLRIYIDPSETKFAYYHQVSRLLVEKMKNGEMIDSLSRFELIWEPERGVQGKQYIVDSRGFSANKVRVPFFSARDILEEINPDDVSSALPWPNIDSSITLKLFYKPYVATPNQQDVLADLSGVYPSSEFNTNMTVNVKANFKDKTDVMIVRAVQITSGGSNYAIRDFFEAEDGKLKRSQTTQQTDNEHRLSDEIAFNLVATVMPSQRH